MKRIALCMVVLFALVFCAAATGYAACGMCGEDDVLKSAEKSNADTEELPADDTLPRSTGRGQEPQETYDENTGLPDVTESDSGDELR